MRQAPTFTIFLDTQTRIGWEPREGAGAAGPGAEPATENRSDARVYFVDIEADVKIASEWAAEIARCLAENGHRGEGVVLAVPSRACFALAPPSELPTNCTEHQALAYAIEPWLPLAAEEVTVAQVRGDATSLCIAIATAQFTPLIDELEAAGIIVQTVCPAALLALQAVLDQETDDAAGLVLWQAGDRIECFSLRGGNLRMWLLLPADPMALRQALGVLALAEHEAARVFTVRLDDSLSQELAQIPGLKIVERSSSDLREAAVAAAANIASGAIRPLAELRTGPLSPSDGYRLVRGPLRFASLCAVLLLFACLGAMLIRAHRFRATAERLYLEQEAVFRTALPGQPVPAGIASRLRSELGKLTIATGDAPTNLTRSASALESMRRVLTSLPVEIKYHLSDIRLDDGQLNVDGETLSHSDADKIATCLRQQGFDVQPPRSQQRGDESIGVHWSAGILATSSTATTTHR